MVQGKHPEQTAVPLPLCSITALPGHCFCWRLSGAMCDVLASLLFSGFIPSIFRDSFSSGLTMACAFGYLSKGDC